jgi:thiol:disulfide interchange protein
MPQLMKMFRVPVLATLLAVVVLPNLSAEKIIYPAPEQAKIDLAAGLKAAAATHKRIILDFGGNWCGDCQVLDIYFHDPANKPILDANFVLVHVNIGSSNMDENVAIAERYEIPLKKGVPALAVLDEHGKLLYSQKTGEFEAMRRMESNSVTDFLIHWKPVKPGCSAVQLNC